MGSKPTGVTNVTFRSHVTSSIILPLDST